MGLKFRQGFVFYGPEKATQWLETRLIKIEEQLKESVNYCLKQNTSFLWKNGFVILNIRPVRFRNVTSKSRSQSGPQESVRYNMSTTYKFFYESFYRLFIHFQEKCPLCRMPTIRRFHCILLP